MRPYARSVVATLGLLAAVAARADVVEVEFHVGTGVACDAPTIADAFARVAALESALPADDTLTATVFAPAGNRDELPLVVDDLDRGEIHLRGGYDPSCNGVRIGRTALIGTASASRGARTLSVTGLSRVTLERISLRDNTSHGAVFLQDSELLLDDVDFVDNHSGGSASGGAVQMDNSRLLMHSARFLRNTTSAAGGAIFCFVRAGAPVARGSSDDATSRIDVVNDGFASFENNSASASGGAIMLFNECDAVLSSEPGNIIFRGNEGRDGGALFVRGFNGSGAFSGNLVIADSVVFDQNRTAAGRDGGHVYLGNGNLYLDSDSAYVGGRAGRGGAIFLFDEDDFLAAVIDGGHFIGNRATIGGGAVHATGNLRFDEEFGCRSAELAANRYCGEFIDNVVEEGPDSDGEGGAIAHYGAGDRLEVFYYRFTRNVALRGAAIRAQALSLEQVLIDANDTRSSAGSVVRLARADGTDRLAFSTVVDNGPGFWLDLVTSAEGVPDLVGLIAAGNARGFGNVALGGGLVGSCNIVQASDADVVDAGFRTDPARGDYRLAPESPARLACNDDELETVEPTVHLSNDLDGVRYRENTSAPVDLGAFAFVAPSDLLVDGFE